MSVVKKGVAAQVAKKVDENLPTVLDFFEEQRVLFDTGNTKAARVKASDA